MSLFTGAGGAVDGVRVRIPGHLVANAVETAPASITVHDRAGATMFLQEGPSYFGTSSDCLSVIDPETGQHRDGTKSDVARITKLCDGLENIDFCMSMGIASDASRVPIYVHQFDAMVRNTGKPIIFTAQGAADIKISSIWR
jgi:trimethylamine--corrinoid protein Co-methyltransferase